MHFTSLFLYTYKLEEVLNLVFSHLLPSQTYPNAVKYELTDICIFYTDPQLITDVIILLRTTTVHKRFLYDPLMGLRF